MTDELALPSSPGPLAPQAPEREAVAVYLASLAPGDGRRVQAGALRSLLRLLGADGDIRAFPWVQLDYGRVVALRGVLQEAALAPATKMRLWAALRGVLREAWRLGQVDDAEWHRIKDVPGRFGKSVVAGRALTEEEVRKLLAIDSDAYLVARDRAIFVIGAFAGLRRAEIAALDVEDYQRTLAPAFAALHVRKGKGSKARIVPLGRTAIGAIDAWLRARGHDPGPLLCGFGERRLTRLSVSTIRVRLEDLALLAGVAVFSPHDLRRTYITRLLARGADVITVSKLAGHESVDTTRKYDRRGEDEKRKAVELLD